MTLTAKTMEWLNQNRYRSYPLRRDEWREKVSPASRLDCVLLDAMVFNSDASGEEELVVENVRVSAGSTVVSMRYGEAEMQLELSGGDLDGEGSYDCRRGAMGGEGLRDASFSLVFSSHAYILDALGIGYWELGCRVLQSRVVGLTDGFGVDGISVNGSRCVDGHEGHAVARGDVVLEDGFRTSPIVHGGRVIVRVGRRYGIDPCHYECTETESVDCRSPLFYFCGQNAISSGNVALKGGRGVSVENGRTYKVKSGAAAGKTVPCVEIVANGELLEMYRPTQSPEG